MVDEQEHDPFAQDGDWGDEDEVPVRSTGRFVTQIILFVAAILFFLWLVNVLSSDPIWPGFADSLSEGGWIGLLLSLLFIDLLVVIMLLRPRWMQRAIDGGPIFDADPLYMVGCPACGTTFDRRHHEIDEEHEKRFACPNCGREGHLKSMRKKRVHVEDHWCTSCDKHYKVYQNHSQCPHCSEDQHHPLA